MDEIHLEGVEASTTPDVWGTTDAAAQEIKTKQQPVDYSRIIGDARVLLLGEDHGNRAIRQHLVSQSGAFKDAGITHYAIEANEGGNAIFEKLNRGEQVDLSSVDVGPGRKDYEEAIRAMAAQGIAVVAVDIDQSTKPTEEEREARMTANIQKILADNPKARVAYLVGAFHTSKIQRPNNPEMTGKRLADAGVDTVTVRFAGGTESIPRSLTDAVRKAGLARSEFALDMRPYAKSKSVPFGGGEVDYSLLTRTNIRCFS